MTFAHPRRLRGIVRQRVLGFRPRIRQSSGPAVTPQMAILDLVSNGKSARDGPRTRSRCRRKFFAGFPVFTIATLGAILAISLDFRTVDLKPRTPAPRANKN